ncbi:nucleoid-associated protein [Methylomonas sp. SURF-2]|uniref:Nucleoid-associated protein n=1 Tax=Methylomonas subterranea TaxID=2952225 RepID=A0ABT1TIR9_9GAMM|nr:nucleoid-associated protein [Methylomonas sp. SURF-2]MCQ8104942.1 nucleoid-associated protein [Methylomonas sp. SURF-2]
MSFLTDAEKQMLSISRMIFHVVGKSLEEPILLEEIEPPQFTDFFLERVKSALKGNLFEFKLHSPTEATLRSIGENENNFSNSTKALARDFQRLHSGGNTSEGVFFVFELMAGQDNTIYALIKYDNEDVVRYILNQNGTEIVPQLERFRETFVRKAEAMQKIALVRLQDDQGGKVIVKDRSKPTHISDYFQSFLEVRRVNSPEKMSSKLVDAFKNTFKKHRTSLPIEIQRSGVSHIYAVLRQNGQQFDAENYEPLISAIFGAVDENSPIRNTLSKNLKDLGIAEESFEIIPESIQKPPRRRLETVEGTQVIYDEEHAPERIPHEDGVRTKIVIVTTEITTDDIDIGKGS